MISLQSQFLISCEWCCGVWGWRRDNIEGKMASMLTLRPITMVGDGLVLRFRPTPNITTVSARSLREL